jgi:hypothetical protein
MRIQMWHNGIETRYLVMQGETSVIADCQTMTEAILRMWSQPS